MPFVLMRIFERSPASFDFWMSMLTLGQLPEIRQNEIAATVEPGTKVLEIGCGTGALVTLLAERGAEVIGIDLSEEMLAQGREALPERLSGRVQLRRMHALETEDAFQPDTFDLVVIVLTLSELYDAEVDCLLRQCRKVLKPGGRIVILDEVEPTGRLKRWAFKILRVPAQLITFLVLQAKDLKSANLAKRILYYIIEFPLMLLTFMVVPAPSRPVADLEGRTRSAGLRIKRTRELFRGGLKLVDAEKPA